MNARLLRRLALPALVLVAACANVSQQGEATFACEDGPTIVARFFDEPDMVLLTWPGQRVGLRQVEAASGAHYQTGETSFWTKGDEATFAFDGNEWTCAVVG